MPVRTCPLCNAPVEVTDLGAEDVVCSSCGSSFPLKQHQTRTIVFERRRLARFDMLDEVGSGAFGVVWRARDPELERTVALKIPHAGRFTSPRELDRFLREGRSAAQLRHPGIVCVHEVGRHEGLPYIVADFIEGVTLADYLTAHRPGCRTTAELMAQTAEALDYAHRMGVVHRDIKPSNIMLDRSGVAAGEPAGGEEAWPGKPMLMDFGLAMRQESDVTLTLDGQLVGTPAYMSPEQARGDRQHTDARSDVYSLGVIVYQLLTGELPFRGNQRMMIDQVLRVEPRPPRRVQPQVPRDLDTITLKCLAKEPERRYATAGELAADLRRWLAGEPIKARPQGLLEQSWRWARRNPAVASLMGLVAILLLAVAGGSLGTTLHVAGLNQDLTTARDAAENLARREHDARLETEAAKHKAEEAAEESRQRLVRMTTANGLRLMNEGDWFRALPWLAEGLRLEKGQPGELEHRVRIAAVLQQCPRLVGAWGTDGTIVNAEFSRDGGSLLLASSDDVQIWNLATHRAVRLELGDPSCKVTAARFSPDAQQIAVAESRGSPTRLDEEAYSVRVWSAATGRSITPPIPHQGEVSVLSFRPDGRQLATVAGSYSQAMPRQGRVVYYRVLYRKEARIWDASSGEPITPVLEHGERVTSAEFSPDGRLLLTASEDEHARLWKADTGELVAQTGKLGRRDCRACFSPDGKRFATCSGEEIRQWDSATGQALNPAIRVQQPTHHLAFSPDGKRLLASGGVWGGAVGGHHAWICDGMTGAPALAPLRHEQRIEFGAFSPEGGYVATASRDRTARVWDARTGSPASSPLHHPSPVKLVRFSPGGSLLLTVCAEEIRLWAWRPRSEPLASEQNVAYGQAFLLSPDGQRAIINPTHRRYASVSSAPPATRLWAPAARRILADSLPHTEKLRFVTFGPDGKHFATVRELNSTEDEIRVWDAESGTPRGAPLRHAKEVTKVVLSGDGQRLMLIAARRPEGFRSSATASVWDVGAGTRLTEIGDVYDSAAACFTANGDQLFVMDSGAIRVLDSRTGQVSQTLMGGFVAGTEFACQRLFDPDPQCQLLVVSGPTRARVWNWQAGTAVGDSLQHTDDIQHVRFSPNSRWVVTTSRDRTARVWNAVTGEPITPFLQHEDSVNYAAFSPDSRWVVTASKDRTARVWNSQTGEPLTPPLQHIEEVIQAEFTPDGSKVVTAGSRELRVWDLSAFTGPTADLTAIGEFCSCHRLDPAGALVLLRRQQPADKGMVQAGSRFMVNMLGVYLPPGDAALAASRLTTGLAYPIYQYDSARPTAGITHNQSWQAILEKQSVHLSWTTAQRVAYHREECRTTEQTGHWESAAWHWSRLIELEPADWSHRNRRGNAYLRLNRPEDALVDYARAAELNPTSAMPWYNRGLVRQRLKHWDAAIDDMSKALQLKSDHASALRVRAACFAELKQWPKVVADYQLLGLLQPTDEVVGRSLMYAQVAAGDPGAAQRTFTLLLDRFDTSPGRSPGRNVLNNLAWSAVWSSHSGVDPKVALNLAERAIAAEPKSRASLHTLGTCLYRSGRYADAVARIQEAHHLDAKGDAHGWDYFVLSLAHARLGQLEQARDFLQKGIQWVDQRNKQDPAPPNDSWTNRLELESLRREAEEEIKKIEKK